MEPIIPETTQILFAQSEAPVNLKTARVLIIGCEAWLLKGLGWYQIGTHDHAIPDIETPIQTITVPHCTTPILLRLAKSPDVWLDVRVSRSEITR